MFSTEAKNKFSTNLCKLGSVESVYSPYGLIKETFRYYIDSRRDKLGGMIKTVSSAPVNMLLQKSFEVQFSAKSLKNKHSTKECKARILEGKLDISDKFSHLTNKHPRGACLSSYFYLLNYSVFSSVKSRFLLKKQQNSPFFQDEYLWWGSELNVCFATLPFGSYNTVFVGSSVSSNSPSVDFTNTENIRRHRLTKVRMIK